MSRLNVVYASDDGYAFLAGISIISLFENNKTLDGLTVYILSDGISEENSKKLHEISKQYDRPIIIIDVRRKLNELIIAGVHGYDNAKNKGFTAYARLAVHELLPDIDRIIYLDCDTMVNKDISSLADVDLGSGSIGACYDCFRSEYRKFINYPGDKPYYNSGFMVMDLDKWREHLCFERIIDHINNIRSDYPLVDQDLINVVLSDECIPLSMNYNYLSQYYLYRYEDNKKVYGMNEEIYWKSYEWIAPHKAADDVDIFHFCGNTFARPWYSNSQHPMKQKYDEYYFLSPWKNRMQDKYKLSLGYRVQLLLYSCFPYGLQVLAGMVMQRMFVWKTYGV